MYKLEGLNNINMNLIENLQVYDEYRWKYNLVRLFNSNNLLKRLMLWKNIKFLKVENEYVGFIWFDKLDRNRYKINSIKVMNNYNTAEYYNMLLSVIKRKSIITYNCASSEIEYYVLRNLGFEQRKTIIEMKTQLNGIYHLEADPKTSFFTFSKNKDERLRCVVQNKVFSDLSRYPINEGDIYFEENQKYYIDDGCIFIKYEEKVIGYGQIIVDNCKAYIVNFGILKEYRGKGFGKTLLKYLLNLSYNQNYKEIYLKCNENNIIALELYKSMGFVKNQTIYELYKIN